MPSDERVDRALAALAGPIERYRSAVATTLEEIRGRLAATGSGSNDRAERLREELGRFANDRIDADRLFAVLGEGAPAPEPRAQQAMERALETLRELAGLKDGLFRVEVEPGEDLRAAVAEGLAVAGRAFGAARVAKLAQSGLGLTEADEAGLGRFGFSRWSTGERRLAPPLVVTVGGADLCAGALAGFLDGAQRIVLVVHGACSPAPLVRLITPGVLVMQTAEPDALDRLDAWAGPAIAALVPEGAARFTHDPAAGDTVADRLTLEHLPDEPRGRLNGLSAAQQAEELRQLRALAQEPRASEAAVAGAAGAGAGGPPANPADRLAAWLLSQADLRGADTASISSAADGAAAGGDPPAGSSADRAAAGTG